MNSTLKWFARSLTRILLTLLIIIMVAFIPAIFKYTYDQWGNVSHVEVSPENYVDTMTEYIDQLLDGDLGSYSISNTSYSPYRVHVVTKTRAISSVIFEYYQTTIAIFLPGLLLGLILGVIAAFFTLLLKQRWRNLTQLISFFIISVPDFFIVMMLQLLIIFLYKKTGIKIFSIATGGGSRAIFLPIVTLSIFPFIYIYRTTLTSFEEILSFRYVQTAYSKGLPRMKVMLHHVTKNGLLGTLNNMPSIIVPTISNLFIIEYLYNTHGVTMFAFEHITNLHILVISIFLIWLLVETVLLINDFILNFILKYRRDTNA